MYQVPLRYIRVSPDVAICATRIVALMSTKCYQARETIKKERQAGTLLNACGGKAAKTAVFLDNGTIISSPLEVQRLLSAIEKSNLKGEVHHHTKRLKVYDVADEEPNPDIDEEVLEAACDMDTSSIDEVAE